MIDTEEKLSTYLARVQSVSWMAVDTEADSLHAYPEKVCLIQITTSEGDELIDPLAGLDLAPLLEGLSGHELIMHGADYDLRLLRKHHEFVPRAIFDTMLAARLLGVPQFSLSDLVQNYLGVKLEKGAQKANWAMRPLTEKMERYALHDTHYLHPLAEKLKLGLKEKNRLEWHQESCARLILDTTRADWLVNKGRTNYGLNNSDYNIDNKRVRSFILNIDDSRWENGIHKSASDDSFDIELAKLNIKVRGNRFHYLRFKPYLDFQKIEDAGLEFDTSLGFADISGFRNGYGLPYRPYDFKKRKAFNFVECPLNVMDTTYFNYLKMSADEFVNETKEFIRSNSSNAVISLLFHNNFISDFKYKNYRDAFKKLLSFYYESDYKCISQSEVIKLYRHEY